MNVERVNTLNLWLVLVALAATMVVPFELFLLSYAILGPLHYLTEISWLNDRQYFTPGRRDGLSLWALAIVGTLFMPGIFGSEPLVLQLPGAPASLSEWSYDFAFLGFGVALIFVPTRSWLVRVVWIALLFEVLRRYRTNGLFITAFAIYLPTLVHVFVFTGVFMLWGALKGRSRSGYLTFVVFLAAAALAWFGPGTELVRVSEWARQNFVAPFQVLARTVMFNFSELSGDQVNRTNLFEHPTAIAAVRFFGFAYTYHYLNWFSKTSIIKWHEIPAARVVLIVALWLASVGLYLFDYGLGLSWLFALSFGHVVLEFPLNHRSFYGVGEELWARVRPRAKPSLPPETT